MTMTCTAAVVLLENGIYKRLASSQGRIAFGACIGRNLTKDHPNDKDQAPTVVVVMGGHVNQQGSATHSVLSWNFPEPPNKQWREKGRPGTKRRCGAEALGGSNLE